MLWSETWEKIERGTVSRVGVVRPGTNGAAGVVCAYVPTNTAAMDAKGNCAFCLLFHILSTLVLPGLHAPTIELKPHPSPPFGSKQMPCGGTALQLERILASPHRTYRGQTRRKRQEGASRTSWWQGWYSWPCVWEKRGTLVSVESGKNEAGSKASTPASFNRRRPTRATFHSFFCVLQCVNQMYPRSPSHALHTTTTTHPLTGSGCSCHWLSYNGQKEGLRRAPLNGKKPHHHGPPHPLPAQPAAPWMANKKAPGPRRRSSEVQELLDGLMYLHAQAAGPGKQSRDEAGVEARRRMKAWFGSVPVEERVKLLQLHEPAFVKLLALLASKARALPTRRGRRPSMVKFFIFAESVPALQRVRQGEQGPSTTRVRFGLRVYVHG